MAKPQPATRIRTCRACGKQFEYPIKGSPATRFHCDECVDIPVEMRKLAERLFTRVQKLEFTIRRLEQKAAAPSAQPATPVQPAVSVQHAAQ